MTTLDDLTLLQLFASGDATLEANQSLRVQPANKLRQLLGRKGLLLATAYDAATPPRIEVRRDTDYADALHQTLLDHHFMPTGQGADSQVLCYTYSPMPAGYHMNYTEARQLWKQWWIRFSRQSNRNLQLDLLVLAQNQWYPIRDIGISSGTLYVETLRGETAHHGDDMIVWLEKDSADEAEQTRLWAPSAAAPAAPAPPAPLPPKPLPPEPVPVSTPTAAPAQRVCVQAPPPPCRPLTPPLAGSSAPANPALASVVCTREGKIYVKTAVGVVVVEGNDLRAYSLAPRAAAARIRQQV
ncbi:hypothetical protein [Nodosilinea nodulosa]|uniref:hypothetical protein n=1 Tax=Nodosilinea nodulosa TaxID=416001 RepID=UPI0002E566C7|nr:hypothetical protein [Nodosilinea nodulosa]